jgi:hypothetical protein
MIAIQQSLSRGGCSPVPADWSRAIEDRWVGIRKLANTLNIAGDPVIGSLYIPRCYSFPPWRPDDLEQVR